MASMNPTETLVKVPPPRSPLHRLKDLTRMSHKTLGDDDDIGKRIISLPGIYLGGDKSLLIRSIKPLSCVHSVFSWC